MKIATILLFAFTVSCVGFNSEKTKKIYICGDHECKNNAEVKDYFKNNISIEVYTVTSSTKKNKDFNLVQLNMSDKEKNKVVSIKSKEDVIKKELENRKKLAKINVKKGEKIKKIQTKSKMKKKSPLTLVRLCKNLQECDIDAVAKIILDMGQKKNYPDLTVNE